MQDKPCRLELSNSRVLRRWIGNGIEEGDELQRPKQVLEVFRELRRSVGADVGSRELLACAASVVELFSGTVEAPRFDLRAGSLPFDCWALDMAFADGGWRVLALESGNCGTYDEEDEDARYQRVARQLEWRKQL